MILIGGEIRQVSGAATGMLATYCIDHVHADLAFLGTSGFLDSSGPCVENFPEAEVKRRMMQNAGEAYVLADSSKAKTRAIVKYAEWKVTHRPSDRRPAGQAGTEQPEKGTECDRGRYKRRGIDKDNR